MKSHRFPKWIPFLIFFAFFTAVLTLGASAEIIEGRALDDRYIRTSFEDDGELTEEEFADMMDLAPYYKIRYSLDTATGEMHIYCGEERPEQKMLQYAHANWIPWINDPTQQNAIRTVYIEEGVLTVGHYSFLECKNLETVYLPASLRRVDRRVFAECPNLKNIYFAGTHDEFLNNVRWIDDHNSYTSEAGTVTEAKSLVSYGYSVTVNCVNQEGETFKTYTVGGYSVGEAYTVVPKAIEGMTYVGEAEKYTGKFSRRGKTYTLEYECRHEFEVEEGKACGSACIYCGTRDPDAPEHTLDVTSETKMGFFRDYEKHATCLVCGKEISERKEAPGQTVLLILGGVIAVTVLVLAIVLPIRRRRRIRAMTW